MTVAVTGHRDGQGVEVIDSSSVTGDESGSETTTSTTFNPESNETSTWVYGTNEKVHLTNTLGERWTSSGSETTQYTAHETWQVGADEMTDVRGVRGATTGLAYKTQFDWPSGGVPSPGGVSGDFLRSAETGSNAAQQWQAVTLGQVPTDKVVAAVLSRWASLLPSLAGPAAASAPVSTQIHELFDSFQSRFIDAPIQEISRTGFRPTRRVSSCCTSIWVWTKSSSGSSTPTRER